MAGSVGFIQTCFSMMKVFLGIGILATPATFNHIGLVGGILGLSIIGIMNGYTMKLQIASKLKLNKPIYSYSDLGEFALGVKGRVIVDICMVVS